MDEVTDPAGEIALEMVLEGRGSLKVSGPNALVFRALGEFREEIAAAPGVAATAPEAKPADPALPLAATTLEPQPHVETKPLLPLGPYVKGKAPTNNAEAVAVIAVWDHRKNGTTEFTHASFDALWRAAGRKPAGNLARDIGVAATQGWLHKSGRGKYTTLPFGEDFVDSLPQTKKA